MSKKPALSNLVVCAVVKLSQDHPDVFQAMCQDVCDEGNVSIFDVLSVITSRDFDDCFAAVQRAEDAGLVERTAGLGEALLTAQGQDFMESIPLDILQLCRDGSANLSSLARDKALELIDRDQTRLDQAASLSVPTRVAPTSMAIESVDLGVDLDTDFDDVEIDDEPEDVPTPRRAASKP